MLKIRVPATSANIGPGFDCLGLALTLYNYFSVEPSDSYELVNVEEEFNNSDNLFLEAYRYTSGLLGSETPVKVTFDCNIPISRGLGSSSALITAGAIAANKLCGDKMSSGELFQVISDIEGHPDNVAPCLYGGMTASLQNDGRWLSAQISIDSRFKFCVLIPDFEVSTEQARAILPSEYSREDSVFNSSHAILLCEALRTGNMSLLMASAKDRIHEPYRMKLIHDYDLVRDICLDDSDSVFLISGSGSTCMMISMSELSEKSRSRIHEGTSHNWEIRDLQISQGACYWEDHKWKTII